MNATENNELGYSPDAKAQRQAELLELLRQAAPEVVSDNQIVIDRLKDLLGQENTAPAEHYELNWAGKIAARREIQKTTSHTLLPDIGNPESAPHMFIEGENLEVLRVLQKSYYGKVKMIYIDPPYNTGNDSFVYPDDYSETLEEYQKRTGEKNEAGYLNKQSLWKKNSKESGQYHSAWLSMMYPRLYLARNLLRDDGVMFISIDDNEAVNLKLLCNEIFGEDCVEQYVWNVREDGTMPKTAKNTVRKEHEYLICAFKSSAKKALRKYSSFKYQNNEWTNPDNDPRGPWMSANLSRGSGKGTGGSKSFIIRNPAGIEFDRDWSVTQEEYNEMLNDNRIFFAEGGRGVPRKKIFKNEPVFSIQSSIFENLKSSQSGSLEIEKLLSKNVFDYPKPVDFIYRLLQIGMDNNDIALDFFAGSGTTAHAVMELNIEDGGSRHCICVQMPEVLEEASEAYKAGYLTIADITRARIETVITKLKAEQPENTADLACANFTLSPSNFKVWRSDVDDEKKLREQLEIFQRVEKGSTGKKEQLVNAQTAMLNELLLKFGLGALGVHAVSKPKQVAGVTMHRVLMRDDSDLWICFDPYTPALKDEIVKARPAQVMLLNSCFTGDRADEMLTNLQLELQGLDIGLTVI